MYGNVFSGELYDNKEDVTVDAPKVVGKTGGSTDYSDPTNPHVFMDF